MLFHNLNSTLEMGLTHPSDTFHYRIVSTLSQFLTAQYLRVLAPIMMPGIISFVGFDSDRNPIKATVPPGFVQAIDSWIVPAPATSATRSTPFPSVRRRTSSDQFGVAL
jgi:hypothetical protein